MKIKFDLYEVLNDRVTALYILKNGIKLIVIMFVFYLWLPHNIIHDIM